MMDRRFGYVRQDDEAIWGFDRVIRFMSEKVGGLGLFGARNIW